MTERILAKVARLEVCESGHVVRSTPTGESAWMIRHSCGEFTWEDGKFCVSCGKPI